MRARGPSTPERGTGAAPAFPPRPAPGGLRAGQADWAHLAQEIRARLRWIGPGRLVIGAAASAAVVVGGVMLLRVPDPALIGQQAVAEARAAQYVPVTAPAFELLPPSTATPPAVTATPPAVTATVIVHVAGAVNEPGVLVLAATARVVDAVRLAGGPTHEADLHAVNLAAPVVDGQRVQIPTVAEVRAGWVAPVERAGTSSLTPSGGGTGPTRVDINSAGVEELATLPGIGPVTAAAIVADREARGPFRRVEDLARVRGIGSAKVAGLREMARVG